MTSDHTGTPSRHPAPPPAAAPPPQRCRFSAAVVIGAGPAGLALDAIATFDRLDGPRRASAAELGRTAAPYEAAGAGRRASAATPRLRFDAALNAGKVVSCVFPGPAYQALTLQKKWR